MNAEQLQERIAERERQLQAMVQERQRLTNEIMGLQGAIIELKRLAAEMEQESEGEDDD
jgi:predicted  nucleic acid-binding Zn-ribbon protein